MSQLEDSQAEGADSMFSALFILFKPPVDQMTPFILGRAICMTQAIDFNVILIEKL